MMGICVTLAVIISLIVMAVDLTSAGGDVTIRGGITPNASAAAWKLPSEMDNKGDKLTLAESSRSISGSGNSTTTTTTVATTTTDAITPTIRTTTDYFLAEEELLEKEDQDVREPVQEGHFAVREHFAKDAIGYDAPPVVEPPKTWFERLKSFFKPSSRNSVLGHATEVGNQFREKYGGGLPPEEQSLYGGGGGGYGDDEYTGALHRPIPGSMRPDGAMTPIYKPPVKLSLEADFIELNCVAHGRIQQGIRWVKLVGLNPHGHQLFATVADGDRVLFDTYHFGVRTDGRHSRLIIRNPEPRSHYGVYQCQASVAGKPSIIAKEDFVVGKNNLF